MTAAVAKLRLLQARLAEIRRIVAELQREPPAPEAIQAIVAVLDQERQSILDQAGSIEREHRAAQAELAEAVERFGPAIG